MRLQLENLEQVIHNQNRAAECEIGFLEKLWRRQMKKKVIPKRLWDFGIVYEAELLSKMSRGKRKQTGYEEVTGQTPDISDYLDFEFYDVV